MIIKFKNIIFFSFLFFSFIFLVGRVKATVCSINAICPKTVNLSFRDSSNKFIPNASFEIYPQVNDIDGQPKPFGSPIIKGKIDSILGYSSVCWDEKNNYEKYALKVYDKNANEGVFWYYNDLNLSCNINFDFSKKLSAVKIVLRDARGNLRKNTDIALFTQRQDVDNNPIKEKADFITTLNTSSEGAIKTYLPTRERAINGDGSRYYMFEVKGKEGIFFRKYDIRVTEGNITQVNYIFSDAIFILKDSKGNIYPAGSKIEIFQQKKDNNGKKKQGDFLKTIITNDNGMAIFEYPAGTYVARVKSKNGQYEYFWDLKIIDQESSSISLVTKEEWEAPITVCSEKSKLKIIVRGSDYNYIKGLKYEVYAQKFDANKNPIPGKLAGKGIIDDTGVGVLVFNPNPRNNYALKIYDKNPNVGDFWFFNSVKMSCGVDSEITKNLSSITFILRNADGSLRKNQSFSLYTQKFDVDGNPIKEKEDLVSSKLKTTESGKVVVYAASDHKYNSAKKGKYVFSAQGKNNSEFLIYDIDALSGMNTNVEYTFSNMILEINDVNGNKLKKDSVVEIYEQKKDINKNNILGKKLKALKIDDSGKIIFEYKKGLYAIKIKDDTNKNYFIFWNIRIKDNQQNIHKIILNKVKIKAINKKEKYIGGDFSVNVYAMKKNDFGVFKRDKKIITFKAGVEGFINFSLAPGPYLFTITDDDKKEYGKAFYIDDAKFYNLTLKIHSDFLSTVDMSYKISLPKKKKTNLAKKLAGYILLQVEDNGEVWYVDKKSELKYYLKNGAAAYNIMRKFGLGITNDNLAKIPIGFDSRFNIKDTDGDGLSDKIEEAIGIDANNYDTDGDGYNDGEEIKAGYNPNGSGIIKIDNKLVNKLKGRILLQVESQGEAWYINPQNNKRYYMKDGDSAFNIMKFLSLGITDNNLDQIEDGEL